MNARFIFMASTVALLVGCKSLEGAYSPACMVFAGDKITLGNGKFEWQKFTDAVVIDDTGTAVNQFPGYPMQGTYSVEGQILHLESSYGDPLAKMYYLQHESRQYLLTVDQFIALGETGEYDDCVLVLGGYQEES